MLTDGTSAQFEEQSEVNVVKVESKDGSTVYFENGEWKNLSALALTTEEQEQNKIIERKVYSYDSDNVKYETTVNVYAKFIKEFADFKTFYKGEGTAKTIYGYYLMLNDISTTNDFVDSSITVSNNFNGVFDGNGHTLQFKIEATYNYYTDPETNITTQYGLFGREVSGTIKNIHLKANVRGNKTASGIIGTQCFTGGATKKTYLENIFIDIYEYAFWGGVASANSCNQSILFGNAGWDALSLKNVIVNVETQANKTNDSAIVTAGYNLIGRGGGVAVSDVYVIKHETSYVPANGNTNGAVTGIPAYATFEDLKTSGNTFTNFDNKYWNLENGYPVWKA